MRISGQLWGHCIRVLRVEWAGWSFFCCEVFALDVGVCPNWSQYRDTYEWLKHEKISTAKSWDTSSLKFELNTTPGYFFFFFFKWHRNRNEATLSHSGFLQHMHCPFHYSWCVFTDSALNHEEYSCLSFPERALWNERTCTWGAHTKKKACSHLVLEKITCRRLCGSHWRWKKFIWLINSWSISSVKLYATPEFPVLSRNQAARLPLR